MSPAEAAASLPASPAASSLVKKKAAGANEVRERAAAVRTRRLMKELKEIQRLQNSRTDPVFTVSTLRTNRQFLFQYNPWLYKTVIVKQDEYCVRFG